jgi:hypothetical protein
MIRPSYGQKDIDRPEHDDVEADDHEPTRAIAPELQTNLGDGSGDGVNSSGANMAEEAAAPADPSR